MSEEKRIPQSLWTGEGPPPKTDVVLGQVADFLEKLGYGKTLKALKKEGGSNGVPISADTPDEGQGLLDMRVSMAKKSDVKEDSDSGSSEESGSDSDSSSEYESESGSDVEGSDDNEKMVDDEAEVTSDDSSDEESEEEESAALPAKFGQKRKRSASVSSSDSSSSSEASSSASSDSDDDGSSSSGSDSESTSSSSDDSDARPSKRAKINKSKTDSSSDSSSDSGSGSSSDSSSDSEDSSSESSSDSESESASDGKAAKSAKKPAVSKSPAKPVKLNADAEARSGSTSSETIVADNEDKPEETLVIVEDPNAGMHPDRAKRLPTTTVENTLPATKENIKQLKKDNIPFQRVPTNTKVDPRFASNAYVSYDYADRAHRDLIVTKGKGFTKEKNKKKRGSYRGGAIDVTPKGIKFDD